jgi:competence protein ComEC
VPIPAIVDNAGSLAHFHERILALARSRGTHVLAASAGDVVRLGGLRLRVMSPGEGARAAALRAGEDPNRSALVLLVSYRGIEFFMPADAESDVTGALRLHRVEVLKVAHHGSADEGLAGLLQRLRPQAAVIEVGAHNPYGHPGARTLETLRSAVPRVLRTDRDGDVAISLGDQGPTISSEH